MENILNQSVVATTSANGAHIGNILLEMGKLKPEQVELVSKKQKEDNLRFGEAAIKLGLITPADLQLVLSQQFDYPYLYADKNLFGSDLIAAFNPFSPQVEVLRGLRAQLMVEWFNQNKVLSVVECNANDGCTYVAANLAVVFSQLGEKTLLIDANLRAPQQQSYFKFTEKKGLSDILAGRAGFEVINKMPTFLDLSILGAGTMAPNPQELLSRRTFSQLINKLSDFYDVILVDNSPMVESADAQTVTARCGGAVIVSRLNHTRCKDLTSVQSKINATGAKIVGVVLNEF